MASDEPGVSGLFSRAVRETLDAIVAPMVRDALIHDALALAGLDAIPEDGARIRRFTTGALREVAEHALGSELAQSVAEEILLTIQAGPEASRSPDLAASSRRQTPRVVRTTSSAPPTRRTTPPIAEGSGLSAPPPPMVVFHDLASAPPFPDRSSSPPAAPFTAPQWPPGLGSHIRCTTPSSARHPAPPPAEESTPEVTAPDSRPRGSEESVPAAPRVDVPAYVLVSTEEVLLYQTLADWFGARARVSRVRTPAELVRHIDFAGEERCIVILDGKCPSIRPAALAVLLEDQPHIQVVLCRAAAATEQVVLSASPGTQRWLVYREPASLDHVAAECVRLVS